MKKLLIATLFISSTGWAAPHPIHDYVAKYEAYYTGMHVGKSTRALHTKADGSYELSVDGKSTILIFSAKTHEHSKGTWKGKEIKPKEYLYKYKRPGKKKRTELVFDWAKRKVKELSENKAWENKVWPLTLPDGANDNLSYQLAMRQDLINGKRKNLSYKVIRHGRVKTYAFSYLGKERIHTALGDVDSLKLTRLKNKDNWTTLWVAPTLNYALVRLEHFDDGKIALGEISSIE